MWSMSYNPKAIGERSEGLILAVFLRAGKVVLQPFGDNQRYDLVVDEDGTFIRVQCKTGRLVEGTIAFECCSSSVHRGGTKKGYEGQADVFAVYSPDLDKVFIVPVSDAPSRSCRLRLEAPKNGQSKGVRMASDYDFDSNQVLDQSLGY